MKIAALTMFYNEAFIAPFFLKHYEYLDEILVLYETDTTDGTRDILLSQPSVTIRDCHIQGGIDDTAKVSMINDAIRTINADWVYVLDSDEFIFPMGHENPYDFLARQNDYSLVLAAMYQVYRHRTDKDLDPTKPPVPQRVHGDPDITSTVQSENRDCNSHYIKPIVVRPDAGIQFLPGNHVAQGDIRMSPEFYTGSHFQMADPELAIARRMQRKARISTANKMRMMGFQHWNVTEAWIRAECERHLDDPVIPDLCKS